MMSNEVRSQREEGRRFYVFRNLEESQTPSVVNDGAYIHKSEEFERKNPPSASSLLSFLII
ncbi:MAG: hypothetical protein QNJ51_10290 [Calothrix sp. MO_167.B12]|nr:hypothetical protein [Calothrix sp. MO_167.B12]